MKPGPDGATWGSGGGGGGGGGEDGRSVPAFRVSSDGMLGEAALRKTVCVLFCVIVNACGAHALSVVVVLLLNRWSVWV